MSRTRGVIALEGARINLEMAQGALLERENTPQLGERENLGGPVSQLVGGLRDQIDALICILSEGVSPDPDRKSEPDTGGEDDSHDGLMKAGDTSSTWTRGAAPRSTLARLVEGAPGEFHVYFCQTDLFPMTLDWWVSGVPQSFMSRFP